MPVVGLESPAAQTRGTRFALLRGWLTRATAGRVLPLFLFASVAFGLLGGACGEGDVAPGEDAGSEDPGPLHIHGMGVDPAGGRLYIATHFGLYRYDDGPIPDLVGEKRHDLMGFTVAGPRTFVAGGHPELADIQSKKLPPQLGFMRSDDAGKSWTNVSLLGSADLHALVVSGDRVVAFDAVAGRVILSDDGGESWRPGASLKFTSLALMANGELLGATGSGILLSSDGVAWQPVAVAPPLVYASSSGEGAWGVDARGAVHRSSDGKTWERAGALAGAPAAFLATSEKLVAALQDGSVVSSNDGGKSWQAYAAPRPGRK